MGEETTPAEATPMPSRFAGDRRLQARERGLWNGVVLTVKGPYRCLVFDLSPGGANIGLTHHPRVGMPITSVGEPVTLILGTMGMFRGEVAWQRDEVSGIRFTDASLDVARLTESPGRSH